MFASISLQVIMFLLTADLVIPKTCDSLLSGSFEKKPFVAKEALRRRLCFKTLKFCVEGLGSWISWFCIIYEAKATGSGRCEACVFFIESVEGEIRCTFHVKNEIQIKREKCLK